MRATIHAFFLLAALFAAPASGASKGACVDCGTIAGSVSDSVSGAPLIGVTVDFRRVDNPAVLVSTLTNTLGAYGQPLPPGDWYVSSNSANHINVMHAGVRCEPECSTVAATPVTVSSGQTRIINLQPVTGARITGTVTMGMAFSPLNLILIHADGRRFYRSATPLFPYDTGATLPGGAYRVRTANQSGYIDRAWPDVDCVGGQCAEDTGTSIPVAEGASATANFALQPGALVSGSVTRGDDGAPLPGRAVFISSTDGSGYVGAGSGADGSFVTNSGLPPGEWRAFTYADGGLLGETWEEIPCESCQPQQGTPIVVADTTTVTGIHFTLDVPSRIRGTITDAISLAAIEDAEVRFLNAGGVPVATAMTLADGSYESPGLLPGSYFVQAVHASHAEGVYGCASFCDPVDGTAVVLAPSASADGIDIALGPAASIAGTVTGAGGTPLANAVVQVLTPDFGVVAANSTNAAGDYLVGGLQPGDYLVRVQSTNGHVTTLWPATPCTALCFRQAPQVLALAALEQRTGIDIAAVLGGRIAGRVTRAADGSGVAGARVTLLTRDNYFANSVLTAADGSYASGLLQPGEYVARTVNPGDLIDEVFDDVPCSYACAGVGTTLVLAGGDERTADFALSQGGTISGRLLDGAVPFPDFTASVVILDGSGQPVQQAFADVNGDYLSVGLPASTYFVRSENGNGRIDEMYDGTACYWCLPPAGTPVAVTVAQDTGGIDFSLAPGARLGGRVTSAADGTGVPFAGVLIHDEQGRFMAATSADGNGDWLAPGAVAAGTYFLRTYTFGRWRDELLGGLPCAGDCDVRAGTPVAVQAGVDVPGLDFVLEPALFLDGFETVLP